MLRVVRLPGPGVVPLVVAVALLAGCASSPPPSQFPSAEELAAIGRDPRQLNLADTRMRDVPEWQLLGPLPARMGHEQHVPASNWEQLLVEVAQPSETGAILSEAMHCMAREYAHFMLEEGARPTELWTHYTGGACGVISGRLLPYALEGDAPTSLAGSELFAQWRGAVTKSIRETLATGSHELGLAFRRRGERVVVVVVGGERSVAVRSAPLAPAENGLVLVEGHVLLPTTQLLARVNRGRFDAEDCLLDPSHELPDFRVACRIDPADDRAWISIARTPPGSILADIALRLLVRRPGADVAQVQTGGYVKSRDTRSAADVTADLLAALNEVRRQAGREPLELELAEAQVAANLAPHYFGALLGEFPRDTMERITLGLMAGWEVPGTIRRGHFASAIVMQTLDVNRWISAALMLPSGRMALLDPEARTAAIGALYFQEPAVLGALVSSYSFFDGLGEQAMRTALLERLTEDRRELGLGPPEVLDHLERPATAAAERVRGGREEPMFALETVLQSSAAALQRAVNGYVLQGNDLDQIVLPTQLLRGRTLELGIGVSHYQPDDQPWGRYVIMIVTLEPLPTARAAPELRPPHQSGAAAERRSRLGT
jgi:hypothetical protein